MTGGCSLHLVYMAHTRGTFGSVMRGHGLHQLGTWSCHWGHSLHWGWGLGPVTRGHRSVMGGQGLHWGDMACTQGSLALSLVPSQMPPSEGGPVLPHGTWASWACPGVGEVCWLSLRVPSCLLPHLSWVPWSVRPR